MNSVRRRIKRKGFTAISNDALDNPNLSLKAKGLLAIFLSQKEGWVFYMSELISRSADGTTSFNSALDELCNHRYVVKVKMKTSRGRFAPNEYLFDDVPLSDEDIENFYEELSQNSPEFADSDGKVHSGFSATENPSTENPAREIQHGESAANNTNNNNPKENKTNGNDTDGKGEPEYSFPTPGQKPAKIKQTSTPTPQSTPAGFSGNEAQPLLDARVEKLLSTFSRVVKDKTGYGTNFSTNENVKLKVFNSLSLYAGKLDTVEDFVVWLCDNWNAIKETNNLLKNEDYPPVYMTYSSHFFNKYYPLYEKGEKVKRPFDANKLANEMSARAKEEEQYEIDMRFVK